MPRHADASGEVKPDAPSSTLEALRRPSVPRRRSIFAIPAPVKQLFNRFPLAMYDANELPLSAPRSRELLRLYVFADGGGDGLEVVSFNPSCLKYQAYLRFRNIQFRVVSSSNHASPSGSLPFLLPKSAGTSGDSQSLDPIPGNKLAKWADGQESKFEEPSDPRSDAYMALVDHSIRRAWLYALYLTSNFRSVIWPLYILPTSSNSLVRWSIGYDLRKAAEAELLKFSPTIDADLLYLEARDAFESLDGILGSDTWFFGAKEPGLLDAAVFAYTNFLLDPNYGSGWTDDWLVGALEGRDGLRRHREQIREQYFVVS
ncbi:hypothetical protein P152DRAFT_391115 [Eremomyces bilateralis CBS 781.70]|uniref:Mitochondrial outer membrane protein n=1 Tax=Eremomyces bilateralis CBS 781.70 TaxID=1392243 RepID=A0A6G1GC97_9PEZI|nr:uncharacterized protein P152DRAFT_391115 [Eremomyces bilateralis CBS 781.70]KAF1815546.1 hypothetical protein P152DRAFT_391115 [Eremomyces bilateralis CBS 781.70]